MRVLQSAEFFYCGIYSFQVITAINYRKAEKKAMWIIRKLTIQILHYEFLGPIRLIEWGPPMEKVVYIILSRKEDRFNIIFADQCEKTEKDDFFTENEKFKCWVSHAGSKNEIYLSIFPLWDSQENERKRIVDKIILRYKPTCNME